MPAGEAPERPLVLELSEDQRAVVRKASGVSLHALHYTATEAAGVALLATAMAFGHRSPASRRLIELELTPAQSAAVQDVLGGLASATWIVDADHLPVNYSEDWTTVEAVRLGNRGLVVPEHAVDPPAGELVVRMPEGVEGVFGTGRHAATRLAALLLEEHLRPGDRVLDVGTGSGVLAVFAVRLGASHVLGIDTSPAAVDVAARTAQLNGCRDQIDVVEGELAAGGPPADLVVANILAGVLLDLLPALAASVRPGGLLLTSGVVDARAGEIIRAADAVGFQHARSASMDGWTASGFRRQD